MAKESSLALKVCDLITKYSIYALVFLVPIFFLPWTTEVLDFNKQTLLVFLVFVSLFALMLKILISGKFEINRSPMHIVAGVLFFVYLLATVFSAYKYGSFWGMPQQMSESMLTVICLLLFYFLVSNIFSRKDILISAIVLSFSATLVELIGILQLFGLFIMPFDFTKSAAFNTIGSVGSLGIFTAILFPLAIVLLMSIKKWWRVFFALEIILSALVLFLVGYPLVWWVVIIGSALTLTLGIMKRDLFDGRWMALPMFFLAVALFFVLLGPQWGARANWMPQKPNEILLSQKAGLGIAIQTIKEKPLFGSGLGTFAFDFSKFKNPDFSGSSFWNITFNKSSSKVLNGLATTGTLGFLAMLAFMAFPIFYGVKFLIAKKNQRGVLSDSSGSEEASEWTPNQIYPIILLGLLVVLIEQSIAYFLYNSNITLDFIYFFAIAALVGLISENKKKYVLKPSSLSTLIVTLVFTLVFIFGMALLILGGQRYVAEVSYYKGLVAYQTGQKADGLKKLESAASLNPQSDVYFRQLSQAYLLGLQDELSRLGRDPAVAGQNKETLSDDEKAKVQTLLANSVNAGKIATDINPQDVNNWSSRGYVYQNLFGVLSDAETWAISSYDSALKLDPNNPYLFFQEGTIYLSGALGSSSDQKEQLLAKAQTQLEKAIALNPNYSNALYSLGIVYDSLGEKDKAVAAFTKLQQLNPADTDIAKLLANLKAGKSILQTSPPVETPPNAAGETVKNPPAK